MSSYTVEGIMFGLQSDPGFLERFKEDPVKAIESYPLSAQERQDVLDWNVRAMSDSGVSNMLLMVAFTAIYGQEGIPEYLRRMNAPAEPEPATAQTSLQLERE